MLRFQYNFFSKFWTHLQKWYRIKFARGKKRSCFVWFDKLLETLDDIGRFMRYSIGTQRCPDVKWFVRRCCLSNLASRSILFPKCHEPSRNNQTKPAEWPRDKQDRERPYEQIKQILTSLFSLLLFMFTLKSLGFLISIIQYSSQTTIVAKSCITALQISINFYGMWSPPPYINVGVTLCTAIECWAFWLSLKPNIE